MTREQANTSLYLPEQAIEKIEEIKKATGISTKTGAIIEAIMKYKTNKS